MYHDVVIAGFGGQGVLFMGNLLAQAGMEEGFHVTFMPAYGVEMRGGTANCSIVISSETIGSPITDTPLSGIIMNEASLLRFQESIRPAGFLFYNRSLVQDHRVNRPDVQAIPVPANDLAKELGSDQVASLVMLGCFVGWTNVVRKESLPAAMDEMLPARARERFLSLNLAAIEKGFLFAEQLRGATGNS